MKRTGGNTNSADSLAKVCEWLERCQRSHKCLSDTPSPLPKRVIDVSSSKVRLCETDEETGRYLCLSHCWGDTRSPCRTTVATLPSNLTTISWDSLPATFQDAIDFFTRRLDLQYIWIDSICIIQDSEEDWLEQSALMANIYESAFITLCATASTNDDGGCYSDVPDNLRQREVTAKTRDGTEYTIYVRDQLNDGHIFGWTQGIGLPTTWSPLFPLVARGWTFQERLLSLRLVHFTAGELMWECNELSACECQPGTAQKGGSPYIQRPGSSTKEAYRHALTSQDR